MTIKALTFKNLHVKSVSNQHFSKNVGTDLYIICEILSPVHFINWVTLQLLEINTENQDYDNILLYTFKLANNEVSTIAEILEMGILIGHQIEGKRQLLKHSQLHPQWGSLPLSELNQLLTQALNQRLLLVWLQDQQQRHNAVHYALYICKETVYQGTSG